MIHAATMVYKNNKRASLFVWAAGDGAVTLTPSQFSTNFVMVRNGSGDEIWGRWGQPVHFKSEGFWEMELLPAGTGQPITFDIAVEGEAYPFIVPGPGIIPSHFPEPEPTILFPAGHEVRMWVDVPKDLATVNIGAWLGTIDAANDNGDIELPGGEIKPLGWKCLPLEFVAYHVADTEVGDRTGWWKIRLPIKGHPMRLTVWEGLPMFFRKPPKNVPYGRIACTTAERDGSGMDVRYTVYYFGQMIAQRDALKGEQPVIPVMPGQLLVQASRGIEFEPAEKAVEAEAGQVSRLDFQLRRVLEPREGWVCGDHHMHSFYYDGAQSPEMMARAARANGLSYMVLTDDDPQVLLDEGLQSHNEEGRFLAMPGTEIPFRGVHMNALNVRKHVVKTGNGIRHIKEWIDEVKQSETEEHPLAILLNHPAHIARVQSRQPYFRSWWMADKFDDIDLVENFDFTTWFDKLNYGYKLPGLWTTDGHDIAFVPPGKKGTYVYVGKELTEASIIKGLTEGRVFNTRYPGSMLYVTVNGAAIGDTAVADGSGRLTVEVSCQSTRPLERIELIADGKVIRTWGGNRNFRFDAEARIAGTYKWVIARAFAHEEEGCWPADDTSMEPLLEAGCMAFTNPVWIGEDTQA